MSDAMDVSGKAIVRVHESMRRIFSEDVIESVLPGQGIPAPRVTLDLPGQEPEPLHVFTWGTARDFEPEGFLTGAYMQCTFHVWVSLIASASSSERAAEIANAYQALALQLSLNDPLLGGLCIDAEAPAVREAEAWSDQSGRRHAGYLLDFGYTTQIQAAKAVADVLKED